MRTNIVHIGAGELQYEIRQIVEIGHNVMRLSGKPIAWENIGDPVQKGEKLPDWMKDIIAQAVRDDSTYAYSPTRGLLETREFLAERLNREKGVKIHPDDIIFFNGLGDAVNKVYGMLRREARVIGPTPAYSTHSSAEAAHAGYPPITYRLDPARGWMPDLEELRNKVKYNESIAGIMIINPDNPTGAVFPRDVLEEMVEIARQYDLFLVGDEIYVNMVFNGKKCTNLSEVIREVPGISLKGISKEFPWPGGRCGWMEVYNQASNPMFQKYVKSVLDAKMLEVCSTTLPQVVIPRIMGNPEYVNWQKQRNAFFEKRSKRIAEILSGIPEIIVNPPDGAFYVSIVFKIELNNRMKLNIPNAAVREYIDGICSGNMEPDRRFVYHLLASRNICVVPLTSFVCTLQGFRCTLLERDDAKFEEIYHGVRDAILEFLNSASL
ncbi:MAG TPA: pyridoxal phosphate-dependent aminotransferase [Leptospiraceae bacterium]|nr:pyridoxal phosphate-dependent aminotransferase [Leptospiraceae bacterium]HMW61158.1 pyridoxal phosphate-dependent aminotransferase [Leptospiraceae bacterium]HMX58293.1 pyridoxal phosphate-dependent aminotransferase [Leptospiraceae bacterium]HNJ35074.1 pyridoxal phosphate-dependent aminotransferase [Leptospiraceae bacterium]HNN74537.1 pyridoxal phosphate-dependent aminotransferase [Leptospiraceae bacterium]